MILQRRADEYGDGAGKKVAVWDLFKRPMMRLMSMNTMFMWFTVAMVYYGLILNGGKLSGLFNMRNMSSVLQRQKWFQTDFHDNTDVFP